MIRIATCQYSLQILSDWQAYVAKITAIVKQAKNQNAQLILLPEYAGTEIACQRFDTDEALYQAIQPLLPRYLEFFSKLAVQHQIYIQPGSILVAVATSQYVNRAYFFAPNGTYAYQDKLHLVQFEKNTTAIIPGDCQTLFETTLGKIGIAICYDSEFPELVRNLVNAGAELILVPSYTNSLASFYRVYISCRARAIENQCYVAMASMVGKNELAGEIENPTACAAVVAPADLEFPDDGIIAQGKMNEATMVFADLSLEKIAWVRNNGCVRNYNDALQAQPKKIILNRFIML